MPDSATPTGVSNTLGYLTISIFQKGFSKLNFRVKLGFQFQLLFNCQRHFRVAIKLDRLLRLIKKFQLTKLCSLVQAQNIELFLTRRVEQKQIYWLNRLRGQSSNRSSRFQIQHFRAKFSFIRLVRWYGGLFYIVKYIIGWPFLHHRSAGYFSIL